MPFCYRAERDHRRQLRDHVLRVLQVQVERRGVLQKDQHPPPLSDVLREKAPDLGIWVCGSLEFGLKYPK